LIEPSSIKLEGNTQDSGGTDEIQIVSYGRGKEGCLSGKTFGDSPHKNCDWYKIYSGVEDEDSYAKENKQVCESATGMYRNWGRDCETFKEQFKWGTTKGTWPYTAMTGEIEVKANEEKTGFKTRPRVLSKHDKRDIIVREKDPLISEVSGKLSLSLEQINSFYKLFEETKAVEFEFEYTFGFDQSYVSKLVEERKWLGEFATKALSPFCISHVAFAASQEAWKTDEDKAEDLKNGWIESLTRRAVKNAIVAANGKDKDGIRKALFDKEIPGGQAANKQLNKFLDEQEFCLIEGLLSNEATYVVKFLVKYVDEDVATEVSASWRGASIRITILALCMVFLCM